MRTKQFERLIEPATHYPQIWRLIVGVITMALVYLASIAVLMGAIWLALGSDAASGLAHKLDLAGTPTGVMLMLASFVGMAVAPIAAARWVHKRSAGSLFGPSHRVLRDFVTATGVVFVLYFILTLIWSFMFDAKPNTDLSVWLKYLPFALLGILVQTGAEELVFRGYLLQQLAARFRSPLVWLLVPALAFGAVHYDPASAGDNVWLMIGAATAFGLVAADLTRLTGSIGAGWGFHFANNVMAILILAVDGSIPGLALYLTPYSVADTAQLPILVGADLLTMLLAWWILRRILQR